MTPDIIAALEAWKDDREVWPRTPPEEAFEAGWNAALSTSPAGQEVLDDVMIAKMIWHRFAPPTQIEWDEEKEKAPYLDCARDILAIRDGSTNAGVDREETVAWMYESPEGLFRIGIDRSPGLTAIGYAETPLGRIVATPPAPASSGEGDELRHKLWMVISHASGGHLSKEDDSDRSINDICVEISRHHNRIWEQALEKGRQEAATSTERGR